MVERDSGHSSGGCFVACAVDLALVLAGCHCLVLGGPDRADPQTYNPLHCAHTLVEVVGPPVCGGGTTANVGDAACAMGWPQCWGSGTKRGRTKMQRGATWGQRKHGSKKRKRGRRMGVGWQGHGWKKKEEAEKRTGNSRVREEGGKQGWECRGQCKGDAGEMHGRRTGDARRTLWA